MKIWTHCVISISRAPIHSSDLSTKSDSIIVILENYFRTIFFPSWKLANVIGIKEHIE